MIMMFEITAFDVFGRQDLGVFYKEIVDFVAALYKGWIEFFQGWSRNWWDTIKYIVNYRVDILKYLVEQVAISNEQSVITMGYSLFSALMFGYLRICFALSFFGAWALLRPAYKVSEFVFRRLLEVDKGPLATLAVFFTAFAKLIEVLLRL